MLQDKIDKIGGFRFTIKGWALTLNTGALVAAFATSLPLRIAILLVSCLMIGLWWQEWRQAKLTEIYQSRVLRIERRIRQRLGILGVAHVEFATLICCPGIAHELRTPVDPHIFGMGPSSSLGRRRGILGALRDSVPVKAFRASRVRRRLGDSDFAFYLLLLTVSVAFTVFQYHAAQSSKSQPFGHLFRLLRTAETLGRAFV